MSGNDDSRLSRNPEHNPFHLTGWSAFWYQCFRYCNSSGG